MLRKQNFDHLKSSAKIALGFLIILLILSAVWYKLRMNFLDAPFVVFEIIKNDKPAIMVGRYGAIITQIFPYLSSKMGLSISILLLLYSMSFNLFYLVTGLILYRIRAYHWVIILAFYQIGFATDSFFWPNNEIHQGLSYLALSAGLWYYTRGTMKYKTILEISSALMLLIAVVTHPLVIPVVAFIIIFMFIVESLSFTRTGDILVIIFTLLVCALKLFLSQGNWYDSGKLNELAQKTWADWLSFVDRPAAKAFIPELFQFHWPFVLWMILLVYLFIRHRRYILLLTTFGYSFLYFMVTTMIVSDHHRFYTESQWMPITIFLVLPLLYYSHKIPKIMMQGITILSFLFWFFHIIPSYHTFKTRLEWQSMILRKMENKSIQNLMLTNLQKPTSDMLMMQWGLPVESLILSTIEHQRPMTFLVNQPERIVNAEHHFISCFEQLPYHKLNNRYFPLDSTSTYLMQDYDIFMQQ